MRLEADFDPTAKGEGVLHNPRIPYHVTTVETADGAALHVRSYGPPDAPAIVLIHGFACRIEYWNPQINELSRHYRVIAYDQRGLGRSSCGSAGTRAQVLGDDLAAVLEAAQSEERPAVIAGHSFGGITIMAWAERHPDQVRRYASAVLLADTVAERFGAYTGLLPFAGRYGAIRRPLLTAISRAPLPLPPRATIRRIVRNIAMSPHATRAQADFLLAMICRVDPRTRVQWGGGLSRLDVVAGLQHLSIPTTVLVGELDRLTPPAASRQIEGILAARGVLHRHVVIPRVGHCSNIEAPAAFDAEIIALLTLNRPRSKTVG